MVITASRIVIEDNIGKINVSSRSMRNTSDNKTFLVRKTSFPELYKTGLCTTTYQVEMSMPSQRYY